MAEIKDPHDELTARSRTALNLALIALVEIERLSIRAGTPSPIERALDEFDGRSPTDTKLKGRDLQVQLRADELTTEHLREIATGLAGERLLGGSTR